MEERRSTTELMEKLDCKKVKIELFERALMTSAYTNDPENKDLENQDALAKVGDSIIGLFAIKRGYDHGLSSREDLHNYRDEIVGNKNLVRICNRLSLYEYVYWGNSQKDQRKGCISDDKYADCFEAIIGAVYLEKGFDETRDLFWDQIESLEKEAQKTE